MRKFASQCFVPLAVGVCALLVLGYTNGREAMTVATLLTVVAVVIWRLAEGPTGMLADIGAGLGCTAPPMVMKMPRARECG